MSGVRGLQGDSVANFIKEFYILSVWVHYNTEGGKKVKWTLDAIRKIICKYLFFIKLNALFKNKVVPWWYK